MTKKQRNILVTSIASVLIALYLFGAGFIYIQYNLSTYSIYYAKHLPHAKDTNPEMALILDHLDFMGDSTIKGLRFDTDGHNAIIKDSSFSLGQGAFLDSAQYEVSMEKNDGKELNRFYFFNKKGAFISYHYRDRDKGKEIYEKTNTRKKEAQAYVDEVITPIADKMAVKPKINLQWLFNRKYQKRFSE